MLRVLDRTELEGFVFKDPGGPPCELLYGDVAFIQQTEDGSRLYLRGPVSANGGTIRICTARIEFIDRGPDRKMLDTRLRAANVKLGDSLSVLCMLRDNQRIAMDFKYTGKWRLKGYAGEKNVLLGKTYDFGIVKGFPKVRFLDYNKNRGDFFRRDVWFPKGPIQEAARNLLSGGNKAICICGAEDPLMKDNFICRKFELI